MCFFPRILFYCKLIRFCVLVPRKLYISAHTMNFIDLSYTKKQDEAAGKKNFFILFYFILFHFFFLESARDFVSFVFSFVCHEELPQTNRASKSWRTSNGVGDFILPKFFTHKVLSKEKKIAPLKEITDF